LVSPHILPLVECTPCTPRSQVQSNPSRNMAASATSSLIGKSASVQHSFRRNRVANGRFSMVVRAEAQKVHEISALSRRKLGMGLVFAAPLLTSLPAQALIDYDEDDELLSKIRADRKAKVQEELISEATFVKEGGFKAKGFDTELVYVQKAINRLSKAGAYLKDGQASDMSGVIGGGAWVSDLKKATNAISRTDEAKETAAGMYSGINNLQGLRATLNLRNNDKWCCLDLTTVQNTSTLSYQWHS